MFMIQDAYAAAAAGPQDQAGLFSMMPMLVIFFGMMYFMVLRPQQKKAKEHKSMLDDLAVGDEIVTAGGIMGKLLKMESDTILLSVSKGCDMMFQKTSIASILPKGTLKHLKT